MARKSRGRQKIEMVKMTNESSLQVTFSKRRFGLFKKASELVSLCGAEVCFIIFSPGNKVFTFGHPNVDTVIDKFLSGRAQYQFGQNNPDRVAEAHRTIVAMDLNNELIDKEDLLEGEKRVGEAMDQRLEACPIYNRWMKSSVDELSLQELQEFKAALESLKNDVDATVSKFIAENSADNLLTPGSGPFLSNFAPFPAGFNGALPFAEREGDSFTNMHHQNLGSSGPSNSSLFHLNQLLGVSAGTSSSCLLHLNPLSEPSGASSSSFLHLNPPGASGTSSSSLIDHQNPSGASGASSFSLIDHQNPSGASGASSSSLIDHQNPPGASGDCSSSISLGFDLGFGGQHF